MFTSQTLIGVTSEIRAVELILNPHDLRDRVIMLSIQAGISAAWTARIRDHADTNQSAGVDLASAVKNARRAIRHFDEQIGDGWRLEDVMPAIARQMRR